jgi:NAD(P)-dependent dehydrogenase (short-subunit alcohol dehydrogenase family)
VAVDGSPRLANKIALITGAGSGIARASALLFAAAGARVACVDLAAEAAEETAAEIRARGGEAVAIDADARLAADAQAMVATTLERWGRLDVLFNVVGGGLPGRVHELDEAVWDRVLETSLKTVFQCSKVAIPHFLDQGHGVIVNTASNLGLRPYPTSPRTAPPRRASSC